MAVFVALFAPLDLQDIYSNKTVSSQACKYSVIVAILTNC